MRKKKRKELEQRIRRIFLDSCRLYGSRKIKEALEQQGVYVTGKTVARIMKELGFA
ncbi:IS3 family transposase [Paenibacillus sp. FSL R10-2748]